VKQHRVLSGLLLVLAILTLVGGVAILFDSRLAVLALPSLLTLSPLTETSARTIIAILIQAFGAVAIGFAYLAYAASRDPVRCVAIVDAFIIVLLLVAGIDISAGTKLHVAAIWESGVLRIVLAAVLLFLRPKVSAIR